MRGGVGSECGSGDKHITVMFRSLKLLHQFTMDWATTRTLFIFAAFTLNQCFWFNSKIDISGSLQDGSSYASVNGAYLRDDFRVSVLIPSLKNMRESIEANRERDLLTDLILFILTFAQLAGLLGVFLFFKNKLINSERYT